MAWILWMLEFGVSAWLKLLVTQKLNFLEDRRLLYKTFLFCNMYPQTPWSLVIQVLIPSYCKMFLWDQRRRKKIYEYVTVWEEIKTWITRYRGIWVIGYMLHNKKILYKCLLSYKENNFWVTRPFKIYSQIHPTHLLKFSFYLFNLCCRLSTAVDEKLTQKQRKSTFCWNNTASCSL